MSSVADELIKAVGSGEIFDLHYWGGSQPGALRQIIPLKAGEPFLLAYCVEAEQTKIYRLERFCYPIAGKEHMRYCASKAFDTYANIDDIALHIMKLTKGDEHYFIDKSDTSLYIYTRFKNGKFRREPSYWIDYQMYRTETYYDPDMNELIDEECERTYKWVTSSGRFVYFQKAAEDIIRRLRIYENNRHNSIRRP